MGEYLGEDFELARRLQGAGWDVAPLPTVVTSMGPPRTLGETIDRTARWMAVVRAQRPWLMLTYPLLFAGTPWAALLCIASLVTHPVLGGTCLAVALLSRWSLAYGAAVYAKRDATWIRAVAESALSDLVILAAWCRACLRRDLLWRGRALRITRGGKLVKV